MGILDGIVEWIAEQVMNGLDLINTSVLGALGCNMSTFNRYFPAAETMYKIFVALAIGLILLNWVWQLFKNYGLSAGIEAEDPVKLSIRSILFILLAYFADEIVNIILKIGGTPYQWILNTVDPIEMARWSYENGYWCSGSGSYHALIPAAAKAWGLNVEGCSASDGQKIADALADGKLVVAIMLKGHFTSSGHFIVLRGVKDGKILVADPASYDRSSMEWDLSIILNEASTHAGAGGPFWIIG